MNKCYRCLGKATYLTKTGKWVCDKNASKCIAIKKKLSKLKEGCTPWNKGTKGLTTSWSKGLTKENNEVLKIKSKKLKERYEKGELISHRKNKPRTKEEKEKLSVAIKKRYEKGWMPKAGRCKKIRYSSTIAGEVLLDGTWELTLAEYLDKQKISWERNKKRFTYTYENKERTYTPDFYLKELDLFLEVKGYETELDRVKWIQFPAKLLVLYKKEIDLIKTGEVLKW